MCICTGNQISHLGTYPCVPLSLGLIADASIWDHSYPDRGGKIILMNMGKACNCYIEHGTNCAAALTQIYGLGCREHQVPSI
ncbi:hypothetical protein COCON_G00024670 [Conger conger]|uniref:Uncharacterized protein n=1 Tax=Conger conger TaxID=82655 RepID=A0A9Q1I4S5_CONCO|nr:hypothetical protein COCON_G00024670 [Conger conger]